MARIGAKSTTGWKATISVAMSNYIEAGSIIAIGSRLAAEPQPRLARSR